MAAPATATATATAKAKDPVLVQCPHCSCLVEILEVNCAIFRHGTYKHNGQQLNPHLPKTECDRLVATGAIHGCGRPFRVERNGTELVAIVCDYI
jgi:hypothetical protein